MLEKFMLIRTILYQHMQTLIKLVFLINFPHELLMSLIIPFKITIASTIAVRVACYMVYIQTHGNIVI